MEITKRDSHYGRVDRRRPSKAGSRLSSQVVLDHRRDSNL